MLLLTCQKFINDSCDLCCTWKRTNSIQSWRKLRYKRVTKWEKKKRRTGLIKEIGEYSWWWKKRKMLSRYCFVHCLGNLSPAVETKLKGMTEKQGKKIIIKSVKSAWKAIIRVFLLPPWGPVTFLFLHPTPITPPKFFIQNMRRITIIYGDAPHTPWPNTRMFICTYCRIITITYMYVPSQTFI